MTRILARFFPAAALCAGLALPAAAAPDGTVMELDLVEQAGQVVAVVQLHHAMGFSLELDLAYEVNGAVIKQEPVEVFEPTAYVETLGDPGGVYAVCTAIDGLIRITGDLTQSTEGVRCATWFPSDSVSPLRGTLVRLGDRALNPIGLDAAVTAPVRRERSRFGEGRR